MTAFADNSFRDCSNLKKVTLPANVTTFGDNVFMGCIKLTDVAFATTSGITTIGPNTFDGCVLLTPASAQALVSKATDIRANAFDGCALINNLTFANAVITTIDANAFANCPALKTLTFQHATPPANLTAGNTVTVFGTYSTTANTQLTSWTTPSGTGVREAYCEAFDASITAMGSVGLCAPPPPLPTGTWTITITHDATKFIVTCQGTASASVPGG